MLPAVIMPVIRQHMSWLVTPDDKALVLTSQAGSPLRPNFRQPVWLPALRAAELPMIHFHDLRHTGNTLAASAGAGLRELMDRMWHSTARAAMIYLHGTDERQQAIADALSKLTEGSRGRSRPNRSGTQHGSGGTPREDR
jgi:integrase